MLRTLLAVVLDVHSVGRAPEHALALESYLLADARQTVGRIPRITDLTLLVSAPLTGLERVLVEPSRTSALRTLAVSQQVPLRARTALRSRGASQATHRTGQTFPLIRDVLPVTTARAPLGALTEPTLHALLPARDALRRALALVGLPGRALALQRALSVPHAPRGAAQALHY